MTNNSNGTGNAGICNNTVPQLVDNAFNTMVQTYQSFFKFHHLPAIPNSDNKISFTERNLTFNFCNCYLQNAGVRNRDKIFVWQELDITQKPNKRGHMDSVIIDTRNDVPAILFIEAKRIANGGCKVNGKKVSKMEGLKNDMDRLRHLDLPGFSTLSPKWNVPDDIKSIINSHTTEIYIMALVDYWEWGGSKNTNAAMESADFEICAGRPFELIGSVSSPKKGDYYLNYCLENLKTQLGKCCPAM